MHHVWYYMVPIHDTNRVPSMIIYAHLLILTPTRFAMRTPYQESISIRSDSCHANTRDVSKAFELPSDVSQSLVLSGNMVKHTTGMDPYLLL